MEIDRLPLQTLNLSVKYVSHWTWLQALRQLYQNFMDACVQKYPDYKLLHRIDLNPNQVIFKQAKRNGNLLELKQTNYISYNKIKKQLIFDNEKSFPIKCLLMGCSQKGPEALGQFGQGMKISMIILLKAGIDIMIQSGEYSYYPTIKSWDHNQLFKNQYDHEVLYIKILKKPSSDKTKVILDNVTQQKFQQFLYLSLALLNEQKFQKLTFGGSSLIIPKDPKLVGKIYKKGVRLQLHESENSQKYKHYSYDFDSVSVGRQRDCVNNVWDLYKLQSQLHYNVILKSLDKAFLIQNPQFKPIFRDHLQNIYQFLKINGMQTHYFHTYSKNNKNVCDAIYDKFLQQNNTTQIYPQYDSVIGSIVRYLNMYGLKNQFYPSVHVSWELWHTLVYSTKYIKIQDKIERDILSKQMRELTPQQQATINQIKQKIVHVEPGVNDFGIKVKNFKELYCCKDKDKNKKIIYVNPQKIKQVNQMTKQLCKMLLI